MPSHRADTPADAPTALRARPSAHPTHPPLQRRRDLRTRGPVAGHAAPTQPRQAHVDDLGGLRSPAGPALPVPRPVAGSRVAAAWAAARPTEERVAAAPEATAAKPLADPAATTCSLDVEAVGALALDLDPLFLAVPSHAVPSLDVDAGLVDPTLLDAVPVLGAVPVVGAAPVLDGVDATTDGERRPAPVQPLRRPRGKARAQAQTTQRAAKAVAERESRRAINTLPQAGIAGALGLATIAVPLAGALGLVPGARQSTATGHAAAAAALTPLPPVAPVVTPSLTATLTALGDRRLLPQEAPVAEVPNALAARRIRVTASSRASRSTIRSVLPGCDGKVPSQRGIQNGRLPASMLCTLWDPKRQLRSDAAVAIAKLNVSYKKRFGHPMCFNDAYRSLSQQYRIKALRGGYAARPGTSEHGLGLAVDLCDGVEDGAGSADLRLAARECPRLRLAEPDLGPPLRQRTVRTVALGVQAGERGLSNGD